MTREQLELGQKIIARTANEMFAEVHDQIEHLVVIVRFRDKRGLGIVSSLPQPYPSADEVKELEAQLLVDVLNKLATAPAQTWTEETAARPQPALWQRVVRLLARIG